MERKLSKYIFKNIILFLMLIAFIFPCFAEENPSIPEKPVENGFFKNINFSIGTGISYLNGQYRELVFPPGSWASPYYSELLWDLNNIFLLNIKVGASKGPWSLDMSVGTAITRGTGGMEDYDWGDYTITDWTNWSESLIFMDNSIFLDISSTYKYTINESLSIPIEIGYKLNYLDWEDQSGKFIYYWDFTIGVNDYYPTPPVTGDFGGANGIDYKIIQNIIYASSGILFTKGKITSGLNIAVSPLIYAWDLDHHIFRNAYFLDIFIAHFWYRAELSFNIKTGKNGGLLLTLFREELPETVGNTYQFDEDSSNPEEVGIQTGTYLNGAGHASILWGIGLSYIWNF